MTVLSFLWQRLRRLAGRNVPPPARASEPLPIPCADWAAVPPVADLERLATSGRHVVLQFPTSFREGKREVIKWLAPQLPGHSVFDSGSGEAEWVTVYKVIDDEVVLENRPLFLRGVRDFS